jgi:Trypsin-like peptidase domain
VKEDPNAPKVADLPGEAPAGAYSAKDGDGEEANFDQSIFPIIWSDDRGHFHLLGTGFYITTNGLFVTARHVLMDPLDSKEKQKYPIGILQFMPDDTYYVRPILRFARHETADVALGAAAPMTHNKDGTPLTNRVLTLTTNGLESWARVVTYAYPKHLSIVVDGAQTIHFKPTYYDGNVVTFFPNGRDRVMLPGPCYQTTMIVHGGASGGPVFGKSGSVFGVNSTGYDDTDISFVSRIYEIFDLTIDGIVMTPGTAPCSVSVKEMAQAGHIIVNPPFAL